MQCNDRERTTPANEPRQATDWSLLISLAIFLIAVLSMWWAIHNRTGEISYTVDDSYIHGTLSKNLSDHGSFGIVPGEFSAASSSPLWTVLLAIVFLVTGPQTWVMAGMATLFGALTIERANALMKSLRVGPVERVIVILAALIYAPMLPIISTGMEHTLHTWTMMGLFACLVGVSRGVTKPGVLFMWAVLAAGARYESLFVLPPLLIWLALRRKWRSAIELGIGMAVPVVGFAIYSVLHGGYVLPNSLMLKGNFGTAFKIKAFKVMMENQYMAVLVGLLILATIIGFLNRKRSGENLTWLTISVLMTILIHLQLAQLGWFYRYEGYLIILGLIAAATMLPAVRDWLRGRPLALAMPVYILLAFATLPLAWRARKANPEIVQAAGNIHDQQVQMAMVTRHLGKDARVAVNDLGAVSFLTDARVLDLYGLGDNSLARAKVDRVYGSAKIQSRLEETRTDFVICYPSWFTGPQKLPETLIPVETWYLDNNLICGGEKVVFYATSPQAALKMGTALNAYRAEHKINPLSTNRMMVVDSM
ncbi:MAG: hypothetical protein V4819_09880 [Verrucomicrobiota bacterium]